jgi:hypothetical protein
VTIIVAAVGQYRARYSHYETKVGDLGARARRDAAAFR